MVKKQMHFYKNLIKKIILVLMSLFKKHKWQIVALFLMIDVVVFNLYNEEVLDIVYSIEFAIEVAWLQIETTFWIVYNMLFGATPTFSEEEIKILSDISLDDWEKSLERAISNDEKEIGKLLDEWVQEQMKENTNNKLDRDPTWLKILKKIKNFFW